MSAPKASKKPGQGGAPGGDADGPSLARNPELEAALREAEAAVDSHDAPPPRKKTDPATGEVLLMEPVETEFIDEELERLREELIESRDRQVRLQADFENFRRRALKERQEFLQFGHENLVKDLLSTVDNLDRAIDHTRRSDGGDLESLLQGVELLRRELLTILANHGVSEIEAAGKEFDPALHEAMAQAPDAGVPPNTVIEELQKGYQLRGRLLRPTRVVVAKAPDKDESSEGGPAAG